MKAKYILVLIAVAIVAGALGYMLALQSGPTSVAMTATPATTERPVLYWYDPMYPAQHFDKPGKSPFMDMQLKARYAGEPEEAPAVRIYPNLKQNLVIRFATSQRGGLAQAL